jgi:hypothetical protein
MQQRTAPYEADLVIRSPARQAADEWAGTPGWVAEPGAEQALPSGGARRVLVLAADRLDLRRSLPYVPSMPVREVVVDLTEGDREAALGPLPFPTRSVRRSADGASLQLRIVVSARVDLRLLVGVVAGPPRSSRSIRWGLHDAPGEWAAGDLDAYGRGVPTGRDDDTGPDVVLVGSDTTDVSRQGRTAPLVRVAASPIETRVDAVVDLPPVDDGIVNPSLSDAGGADGPASIAFRPRPGVLWEATDGAGCVVAAGTSRRPFGEASLARLGARTSVTVDTRGSTGSTEVAWVLAHLACAGVVVRNDEVSPAVADILGDELARELRTSPMLDPGDPIARETASVRQRRAALHAHGLTARRQHLLRRAGHPVASRCVSALLMTRRPRNVAFALAQIERQKGVQVEVVLVLHGVGADHPAVHVALKHTDLDVNVLEVSGQVPFGLGLDTGLRACRGDVVAKWDDDDWYGPHHLADAVLALDYSGADAVGCRPRFVHLDDERTTVVRSLPSERFVEHVTGGSAAYRIDSIRELGFRPVPRLVDLTLSRRLLQHGGRIYATHGLGYCIRRRRQGHTWERTEPGAYRNLAQSVLPGLVLPPEIPTTWDRLRVDPPTAWAFE